MKIEMAESLLRSWLRHCERCQFAELNWKPSPEWDLDLSPELTADFDRFKSAFPDAGKKTVSVGQFLRQAEIDVLGTRVGRAGGIEKLFAIDTAFHTRGLSYGGNEETKSRILKKLVRTGILLEAYFPNVESHVMFVAPVINLGRQEYVRGALADAVKFFDSERPVSFEFCGPEEFRDRILDPILEIADSVSDTSELFLRAQQLLAPFADAPAKPSQASRPGGPATRTKTARDFGDKREAFIAAYYMSKFEHYGLGLGNQSETFERVAKALDVKVTTLRNTRDSFDPYTGSHRRGWWQVELSPALVQIQDEFKDLEEAELRKLVLQPLKQATGAPPN